MGKASLLKRMEHPIELRDKNDNIFYYEDSNGFWWKRKYDTNNNEIYFENSDGFWWKREYDSNNNEIYFENYYGCVRDNRPKNKFTLKEIEEMLGIKNIQIVKG